MRVDLPDWLATQLQVVKVQITQKDGSAPRGVDAMMLVAQTDIWGTIGGGAAEFAAIQAARDLLRCGDAQAQQLDLALGPQTGQCCGGRIVLNLRPLQPQDYAQILAAYQAQSAQRPQVLIFGAGHVGRALAQALLPLPLRAQVFDARADQIALLPRAVRAQITALPEAAIDAAPPHSAFVVATHDHGLDFALTERALARGDAAYVGMIGSATKRARFIRFVAQNAPQTDPSRLTCPMGNLGLRASDPSVIAAQLTVELLRVFDQNAPSD